MKTSSKKFKYIIVNIRKVDNEYNIYYEINKENNKSQELIKLFNSCLDKRIRNYSIFLHRKKEKTEYYYYDRIFIYQFAKEIFEINLNKKDIQKFIQKNQEHKVINSYLNYLLSKII